MKNLTRSATFGYLDRKFSNPPNSQDAAGASCKAGCSDSPCMRICGIRNNWAWQNMTKQNIYPNYRDHGLTFAAPAIAFSEDSESLEAHGSTGQLATFAELKTAPLTFDIHSLPLCSFQVRQLWQPKQILSDHETHKNTENTHPRFYSITAGMGWAAPSGLKARLGGRVLTETPLFWSRCDKWAVLISSIPKSPTHQSLCGNHTKIWKKKHIQYTILHPHFWSSCSAWKNSNWNSLLCSQDLAGDILHRRLRGRAQALAFRLGIEEERGRRGRGGAAFQPWKGCFGWGRGLELANMYTIVY